MNKAYLVMAIVLGVVLASAIYTAPFASDYESLTAENKLAFLWAQVLDDKGISAPPVSTLILGRLVLPETFGGYSFTPTGELRSDLFPSNKSKGIHGRGLAATGRFDWLPATKNMYSGAFKKADYVFLRFSVPATPSQYEGKLNYSPGLSIKVLRDGVTSGNFVSMYSLKGQSEQSYFAHCLGNQVDWPVGMSSPEKLLFDKFSRYDDMPSLIGISDLGDYTEAGVKESTMKTPMVIYWQPNPAVVTLCANVPMNGDFFGCLPTLKKGTVLYKLYGINNPLTTSELKAAGPSAIIPLGNLVLTSDGAKQSIFADEKVHFRHTYWQEELKNTNNADWDAISRNDEFKLDAGCNRYTPYVPIYN